MAFWELPDEITSLNEKHENIQPWTCAARVNLGLWIVVIWEGISWPGSADSSRSCSI
jgi:hypothetical protein